MSSAHDSHGHDSHGHDSHGHDSHGHDSHGHDSHGHGAHGLHDDLSPAEQRDVIADFGFYAASAIAGAAFLLQAFVGNPGAPPQHAEVDHAVSAIREGH